eukprot:TRINITY_DN16501_c0_g1_i1.p1 TRINITY_DN16501_c0_g1~~TRINITY_DN16501_c0_g1_i1.p1  ORF type:complete len:515 (+),score=54.74 TRINITY_DN16501_c0_g1_i1:147-1691(+)
MCHGQPGRHHGGRLSLLAPLTWLFLFLGRTIVASASAKSRDSSAFHGHFCQGMAAALAAIPFERSKDGGLGGFKIVQEFVDEAVNNLTLASRLRPHSADARAVLGIVQSALLGLDEFVSADTNLNAALSLEPTNYLALVSLGVLRNDIKALRRATRHSPTRAEAWLALGSELNVQTEKNQTEAFAALRRAVALRPDSRHLINAAGVRMRLLGRDDAAAQLFNDATAAGLWHDALQRPSFIFWPGFRSEPLLGEALESRCSWCRFAREATEQAILEFNLAAEFRNVRHNYPPQLDRLEYSPSYWVQRCDGGGRPCTYRFTIQDLPERGEGGWAEYTVWDPRRHVSSTCFHQVFPGLCALATGLRKKNVPLTRVCLTEVYPPFTRIPRHHSPQPGRLRLLCPLDVAAGSVSRLIFPGVAELRYGSDDAGRCFWFDESFEHYLEFEGQGPRASIVIDVPHPDLVDRTPPLQPDLEAPEGEFVWSLLWRPLAELAMAYGLKGRPQVPLGRNRSTWSTF